MIALITGMLAVVAFWLLWSAVFVGFGHIARRLLSAADDVRLSFDLFWTGLALVILFLQVWHLFLPVDWKASLTVIVVGLSGLIPKTKDDLLRLRALNRPRLIFFGAVPVALWLANVSLRAPWNYDSGLYHFQMIRWLNEYAIVPGLGNLEPRLAFNQSYFLYPALLNIKPLFLKGYYVANSLLFVVLISQLTFRSLKPLVGSIELRIFSILMLALLVKQGLRESLSSPSPDFPVSILGTVTVLWLIECLIQHRAGMPLGRWPLIIVVLMSCAGITFKLSFLAVGASATVIVFYLIWKSSQTSRSTLLGSAAAICAIFLGLWIPRGVITSGYPWFPLSFGGVNVDWKIPDARVAEIKRAVLSWARIRGENPDEVLNDSRWLKRWSRTIARNPRVTQPLLISMFCLVALGCLHVAGRNKSIATGLMLLPLILPILWLVFWFFTAPDPRFAFGAFNLLAAWSGTLLLLQVWTFREWNQQCLVVTAVVIALILALPRIFKNGELTTRVSELPSPPLDHVAARNGLVIHVPRTNDQAWDAPLPSAPWPNRHVELRGRSLQEGFKSTQ